MRKLPVLALLAALAGGGRGQNRPEGLPAAVESAKPDRGGIAKFEFAFEERLRNLDPQTPFMLLGATVGIYLPGYGAVFTTPLDLMNTPQISPFQPVITNQQKVSVHTRKVAHLPMIRQFLREQLVAAARALPAIPPGEKIAIAIRLYYLEWEDKAGLPTQITMSADRESALAGNIATEEQ